MSRTFRSACSPLALLALVPVLACGRGEKTGQDAAPARSDQVATPAPDVVVAPSGPVDSALAEHGGHLFQGRGCTACHRIGGGRLTGPDLQGVTTRRSEQWIIAMITQPDSMLKTDPTARGLLMEYGTPMANLAVSPDEARALYEYLRGQSH